MIEILIVVVILGVLAAIVIPQFAVSVEQAEENAAKAILKTVRSQVMLFGFRNNGAIPTWEDLEDGYLSGFTQPDGHCIAINPTTGEVTLTQGPCQ